MMRTTTPCCRRVSQQITTNVSQNIARTMICEGRNNGTIEKKTEISKNK